MNSDAAKDITEYWASMVATFLDEVRKAYDTGSRKDRAVAVAKLGQVGSLMQEYFLKEVTRLSTVAGVMDHDTVMTAALAARKVVDFHNQKIDKVGRVDNVVVEALDRKQERKDLS